ncbi:MAG: iron ABC transporter permease [Fusobacterium sp.]|nr:iron ABC transporter permease [Fusobacterium sp.]
MKFKINFNCFLFLFLMLIIFFSLFYGAVKVPIFDILKIFLNKTKLFNLEISNYKYIPIILYVRLPRIMVAIIVGGTFALCGCTMQSLLKNPIVDSGIIGISGGANLGAVIAVALGLTVTSIFVMPLFSGIFALLISAIIYKISTLYGRTDNLFLILAGIAIGGFAGALTSAILGSLPETAAKEYIFWSMGSLNGRRWEHFFFGLIPICILSPILFSYGKELNILLLGEEEAKSLGINVKKIRRKILIVIALLTSISVCISGNITFVGLIVPHILRRLIGSDNRKLLKSSFLAGACFLTLSDLLSRVIFAPKEISAGIITVLVGAPYFIYLIIKIRREGRI